MVDGTYELIKERLAAKRYKIREENGNILAEKNRFSRWGPYVNHIGLIIFLIGGMLRFVPGMYVNEYMRIPEGETVAVPGTNGEYYVKNNQFIIETYDKEADAKFESALERTGSVVSNYQTNATLYKHIGETIPGEEPELEKVKDFPIIVNDPLKFESFALYQTSYEESFSSMNFSFINKSSEKSFGEFTVDLKNPKDSYDLGDGYKVQLASYFPDFEFDENNQPTTKSRYPNNPAFIFNLYTPGNSEPEVAFIGIQQNLEPMGENEYAIKFSGIDYQYSTYLTVRKDLTLWVLGLGGLIFMIGVVQGAYWQHRRIWLQQKDGEILVAAHTNKNWYGIKREINEILEGTPIPLPVDQTEEESSQTKGGEVSG